MNGGDGIGSGIKHVCVRPDLDCADTDPDLRTGFHRNHIRNRLHIYEQQLSQSYLCILFSLHKVTI